MFILYWKKGFLLDLRLLCLLRVSDVPRGMNAWPCVHTLCESGHHGKERGVATCFIWFCDTPFRPEFCINNVMLRNPFPSTSLLLKIFKLISIEESPEYMFYLHMLYLMHKHNKETPQGEKEDSSDENAYITAENTSLSGKRRNNFTTGETPVKTFTKRRHLSRSKSTPQRMEVRKLLPTATYVWWTSFPTIVSCLQKSKIPSRIRIARHTMFYFE